MSFLWLVIGFVFLIKGADIFVDSVASIAKKLHVPSILIGLTIVAMGTSAPEAAVSVTSSLAGQNDMSIANIIGSNFFNILIVLGTSSIITTLKVDGNTIKKDAPFLILASSALLLFVSDLNITRIEGIILLSLFTYFILSTIKQAKISSNKYKNAIKETAFTFVEKHSILKLILFSIFGTVGIVLGGDMVVNSACTIATTFGMSDNLVGLTIVAVGTSLPEFVTSMVAIRKGENDLAIGNVIGSNIFNILLVLGLSMSINPISVSLITVIDIYFMIFITVLLYLFMRKNNSLLRRHGFVFISLYITYITYTILR